MPDKCPSGHHTLTARTLRIMVHSTHGRKYRRCLRCHAERQQFHRRKRAVKRWLCLVDTIRLPPSSPPPPPQPAWLRRWLERHAE